MSEKKQLLVTHLWRDEYCLKCYQCGYNNIFKLNNAGEVVLPVKPEKKQENKTEEPSEEIG